MKYTILTGSTAFVRNFVGAPSPKLWRRSRNMSCELLTCALTRLHIDFATDEEREGNPRGERVTMNFDFEAGSHVETERQFRLTLWAKFSEHTIEKKPLGFQVETTIVGFFRVSDDIEKENAIGHLHVNGVNTLYGTLRGIIMTATGAFPTGPMILKTRTAQQMLGIERPAHEASPKSANVKPERRKRAKTGEEAGVAAAQRVFAKVLEKADPTKPAKLT